MPVQLNGVIYGEATLGANTYTDTQVMPTIKLTTGAADGAIPVSDADGDMSLISSTGTGTPVRNTSPIMTSVYITPGTEKITNGTFASGITDWDDLSSGDGTFAWNTDHAELDANTGTAVMGQTISVTTGKYYLLTVTLSSAATAVSLLGGTSAYSGTEHFNKTFTSTGAKSFLFAAAGNALYFIIYSATNEVVGVDNVSIKEVSLVLSGNTYSLADMYSTAFDAVGASGDWAQGDPRLVIDYTGGLARIAAVGGLPGTYVPISFYTGGGESIRIGTDGTLLLSAAVTAPANGVKITGSSTGVTILASAISDAGDHTITFPAVTDTAAVLGANTFTGTQKWAKGADVASANALTLGADGNYFDITGTTSITSIGTVGIGTWVRLHFDGALTLTHHATDLILPSGANITTAAGDEAEFVEYATGDWRCVSYTKATGKAPVESVTLGANTFTGQQTFLETMDTVYTITDGAAFEIDPANGNIQVVTLGAARTPAATNFAAGQAVLLGINDGTAYAITWTTVAPTWVVPGGTAAAPTLATTGYTWILLWKVSTTIYACEVGQP